MLRHRFVSGAHPFFLRKRLVYAWLFSLLPLEALLPIEAYLSEAPPTFVWTFLRVLLLPVTKYHWVLSPLPFSEAVKLLTVLTVFAFGQLGLCICGIIRTPAADAVLGINKINCPYHESGNVLCSH